MLSAFLWDRCLSSRPLRRALVALLLGLLTVGHAGMAAGALTSLEYRINGTGLFVSPMAVSVPKGIAGSVLVTLSGGDATQALAQGAYVEAFLRGPGLPEPRRIVGRVNEPLLLPPLNLVGDYQLDSIRLVDAATGGTRMEGTPAIVPVRVFDEILVSRVTSRPLTYEEIQEKGIFIDESNFRVVEFEAAFVLDGKTIPVTFPVVAPKFSESVELIPAAELEEKLATAAALNNQIASTAVLPPEFEVSQLNIQIQGINFQAVDPEEEESLQLRIPPIPALMVIPGNIGYLNQFFSVQIFTENAAPAGSGLHVYDIRATLKLPLGPDRVGATEYARPGDDPLRFARVGPDKVIQPVQSIVQPGADGEVGTADDNPRLRPGEAGQAEFLVEGLQEGLHVMDLDLEAVMDGLAAGPVRVKGKAAGSVLVRNPRFSMAFSHPRTVRVGEIYEASVTLLNTGITPANLVQVTLNKNSISGARLEDESQQTVELGTLEPGQSATATYRFRALRTGAVSFSNLTTSDDSVVGRFRLSVGVDERGVALSPDSIAMPDLVNSLPAPLLFAANRVLGQALSVATAGQLPPGVIRIGRSTITRRVLDLAEAGQRLRYGDPASRVLADLLRDWQGGRELSAGFDQILRETEAGREWREALFQAMEAADVGTATQRLADRSADYAGLGQAFVVAGGSSGLMRLEFGEGESTAAATATADRSSQPEAVVYRGARGAWGVSRHHTNLTAVWRFTNGPPSAELVVVQVSTNGTGQQWRWTLTAPPSEATYRFSWLQADAGLQVDLDSDGVTDATVAPGVTEVRELPPALVAVEQDLTVLSGRPGSPCIGPDYRNYGTVVAVVFSKPMTQATAGIPEAYTVEGGNGANSVQLQPGGRVAYLNLRKGISAILPRRLTIDGVTDGRSNLLATVTAPIRSVEPETGVPFKGGVAIRGRAIKGDGSPAAGIPVTLTMYDQAWGPFSCEAWTRRVSQVISGPGGDFDFDFVMSGIPYSISATDTSGLSEEALQIISQNSSEGQVERDRIVQLATSAGTRDTLLGLLAVGSIPEAVAKVEGLDRALVRDAVVIGSGREGQTVPIALRFRGRGVVVGQVVGADGRTPVPRAAVNLFPDPDSRELGRGILADSEGRFAFYGVPLGIYSVEVQTSDRRNRTVAGILARAGEVASLIVELPDVISPVGSLQGTVFEADNRTPHAGARVFIGRLESGRVRDVVRIVDANEDGNWMAEDLPARLYDVVAVSFDGRRKGVRQQFSAAAGVVSVVNVALEDTTRLFGRVQFEDGRPAPNALVAGGVDLVRTDSNGNFVMDGVPVGNRTISAGVERNPDAGIDFPRLGSEQVNIIAGTENYVVVKLRAAGRIYGRVTNLSGQGIGGIRVAIPVSGGFFWTDADSQGNYTFENLTLGRYTVSAPANATAPQLNLTELNESIRSGNEDEILAAFEEAIRVFVGADDPLITGEQRNFRPITWGFTETRLQFDGQSVEANVRMLREGTLAGRVLNHQGVPIGARVRLTGLGPALNGEPKMTIRGERDTDPATGLFIFPGQLLTGPWTVQVASPFYPSVIQANGVTTEIDPNVTNVVLQFPPIRETNGRLVGQVLNPEGEPVGEGVRVKINFSDDYEIQTDESGRFDTQIALPSRLYRTEAIDDESGLRGEAYVSVAPGITNQVEIRLLTKSSVVEVTVLRGNGQPAGGAQVDLDHGSFPRDARVTLFADAAGRVRFEGLWEGSYAVSAQYVEGATRVSARSGGKVGPNAVLPISLRLGATGTITGRFVKVDQVTAVEGAQVAVGNLGFATTDADGRFRFEGVPLGNHVLTTSDPVSGGYARGTASLTVADQTVDMLLIEAARGVVEGYVLDSYGQGYVAGASVRIAYSDGLTPARTVTTGPDGRFVFPGSPVGGFSLSAKDRPVRDGGRGTSGSAAGILSANPGVATVDIALTPLGSVPVQVVREDGVTPAPNVTVFLRGQQQDTGDSGRVLFSDLPLGRYPVTAISRNGGELRNGVSGAAFVERAGTNLPAVLVLPGVGRITGRVVGSDGASPIAGAEVVLTLQSPVFSGQRDTVVSGPDGTFVLEDVAVGNYRLSASSVSLAASLGGAIGIGGEVDDVVLRLGDSGSVVGRLVRADGVTPVTGLDVLLTYSSQSANPGRAFVRTGADGGFRFVNIPTGSFTFDAAAPLFGGLSLSTGTLAANGQEVDLGVLRLDEAFPAVVEVMPADTAEEIPTTTEVHLLFSEALAPASINTNGIFLRSVADNRRVHANVELMETNGVARLVRLVPVAPLVSEQIHEVIVVAGSLFTGGGGLAASGPKDLVGRSLTVPFVSRFRTADNDPPVLLSLFPATNDVQIDPRAVPRLSFNESLLPTGFAVSLTGPTGPVLGTASLGVNGRVLSFIPADLLRANATYTLTVSNVFDLAGNRAAGEPFVSTFQTLDTVGPTISVLRVADGRSPVAGAVVPIEAVLSGVEPGASVRFTQDFTPLGSTTNEPFRMAATLPMNGSTTFRAIATDQYGNDGPLAELVVTVQPNRPPTLVFTRVTPTAGPARTGSFVAVDVEAVDDSGIGELRAIVAGIGAGELARTNATRLRVQGFVSAAAGPGSQVQIFAEARDNIGQSSGQQVFRLDVTDGTAPEIAMVRPVPGSRVDPAQPLELAVAVRDNFTNATVTLEITGAFTNTQSSEVVLESNAWRTNGFVVPLADLPQTGGTLFARATITDGAGNASSVSALYRLTDSTYPVVQSILPVEGSFGASGLPFVTLRFSEALDTNTVSAESVVVRGPGGIAVPGTLRILGTNDVVLWTPTAPLQFGSEYTVALSPSITDSNDNPIDPFTSRFTVTAFGIESPTNGTRVVEGQEIALRAAGANPAAIRQVGYQMGVERADGMGEAFPARLRVPMLDDLEGDTVTLAAVARMQGTNVARGTRPTASSEDFGGSAARIVDGNRSGAWSSSSVAHTRSELHPWFEVDLGRITQIQRLGLYFRTDGFPEQSAVAVLVAREPFVASDFGSAQLPDTYANGAVEVFRTTNGLALGSVEFSSNSLGRYVRVVHLGSGYLTLGELEVYDGPDPNLTRLAQVSQSSTLGGYPAANALDGLLNTFSHSLNEPHAYLDADLGAVQPIGHIQIDLRADCCQNRNRFAVLVAETPFDSADFTEPDLPTTYRNGAVEVYRTTTSFDQGRVRIPTVVSGRYVRVVHLAQDYLHVAELEVHRPWFEVALPSVTLPVVPREADSDGDGLTNGEEVDQGSNPFRPDKKPVIALAPTLEWVEGVLGRVPVPVSDEDGNLREIEVSEMPLSGPFHAQIEFWNLGSSPGSLAQIDFSRPPTVVAPLPAVSVSVSPAGVLPSVQVQNVAARVRGPLGVVQEGLYEFFLTSDDGSRLSIDGTVVVDHDNQHGPSERRGWVWLTAGVHALEVLYFNAGGEGQFQLAWQGPGLPRRLVDEGDFRRLGELRFVETDTNRVTASTAVASLTGTLELRAPLAGSARIQVTARDADGLVTILPVEVSVLGDVDRDGIADRDDADIDGDTLANADEQTAGTDPRRPDTDGDGLADATDPAPLTANRIPVAGAGGAFRFDGVDDVLMVGSPEAVRLSGDLTLEFWIRPENTTSVQTVISKAYAGEGGMALLGNGVLRYHYGRLTGDLGAVGTDYVYVDSTVPLVRRAWTHVALVRDLTAGRMRWYFNGIQVGEAPATLSPGGVGIRPWTLGNGWAGPFVGELDEVRLWARVRTADEIRSLMRVRVEGDEPGLAAAWSFEGVATDITRDSAPGAVHARLGSATESSRPTPVASGVFAADALLVAGVTGQDQVVALPGVDLDGSPLTATVLTLPSSGVLYQTSDGTTRGALVDSVPATVSDAQRRLIFVPATTGSGEVRFQYAVSDGAAQSFPGTATIQVAPVNRAPTAVDDERIAFEGSPTVLDDLVANDVDLDGDALRVLALTQPGHGTLALNGSGQWVYTPEPGFRGTDSFQILLADALSWNRDRDYRPGVVNGSIDGNPSLDRLGLATWRSDFLTGGGMGSERPWYLQTPSLMVWDRDWFGSGGLWAFQDNFGASVSRVGLSHNLTGGWFDTLPAVTWIAPISSEVDVVGEIELEWNGNDSIAGNTAVEVVLARRRRGSGEVTPLLSLTVPKPTASSTVEFLRIPVAVTNVEVAIGDEVFLTHRGQASTGAHWVSLYDRLTVVPSDASRRATVTLTVRENSAPVALAHPENQALRFDGVNDYVRFGQTFNGFPTNDLTVEFWMRSADRTKGGTPFSYSFGGQDNEFMIINYQSFDVFVSGGSRSFGVGATDGRWRHVAVTRVRETGETKMYLDGVLSGTQTFSPGVGARDGGILILGQDQDSAGGGFSVNQAFAGLMDEVRIWNRARTQAELAAGRFVRAGGSEPGLVAAWSFNEASGLVLSNSVVGGGEGLLGYGDEPAAPVRLPDYVPFDEVYQATEDTALPVILAGTDADNDPLTAVVTSLPAHGTLFETVDGTTPSGPLSGGRGRRFDGIDDVISIPENAEGNLSGRAQWSVTAWIRPQSAGQAFPVIYAEGDWRLSLGLQRGTGRLDSWVNDTAQIVSDRPVTFGEWQHVALTSDGTNRTFYINGQPAGSGSSPAVISDGNGAAIGGVVVELNNGRNRFEGDIDDVAIWSRALSPSEMAGLVRQPLSGTESGLMAWWPLDEIEGTGVADATGNGTVGVAGGPGAVPARIPGWTLNTSPGFAATLPRVTHPERRLIYRPDPEWSGLDEFTYRVNDGKVDSNEALLIVRTRFADDPPTAVADAGFAVSGFPQFVGNVLTNDFDIEGAVVTFVDFTPPSSGTLTSNGDGTFVYQSNPGFVGTDSFTYRISDGISVSAPATVTLEVTAPSQFRWVNAAGGNWSNPANWNLNRVPTATDDVFIDEPGTYTVTVDVNATVRRLVIGGASGTQTVALAVRTLTVLSDSFIRPNGAWSQTGGTLLVTGSNWTVEGGYRWTGGAVTGSGMTEFRTAAQVVLGVATADLTLDDGRRLVNRADVTLSARRFLLRNSSVAGATLENRGNLRLEGEVDLEWINSSSARPVRFINVGTVEKTGVGTTVISTPVSSSGPLQVTSGTLRLNGGGELTAMTSVALDGTVAFAGGEFLVGPGGTLGGEGVVELSTGILVLLGDQTIGRFRQSGGEVSGAGALRITGEFSWTAGRQSGAVVTEIASGATAAITGANVQKTLAAGRQLVNRGTLTVSGNWIFLENNEVGGAGVINHGTLQFDEAPGIHQTANIPANPTLLDNRGTMTVSVDPANADGTRIRPIFQNTGTLSLVRGTTILERDSTHSGTVGVLAEARLGFVGGAHTFVPGCQLSGAGAFHNYTGTVSVECPMPWTGPVRASGGTLLFSLDQTFGEFVQGQENGASTVGGVGVLTVTNRFTWNGGTLRGAGRVEVAASATATLGGGNKVLAAGMTLVNRTEMTLSGGNLFLSGTANEVSRFENRGTFVLAGNEGVANTEWDGVRPISFVNLGTLRKSGAGTTSLIDVPLENSGVLDLNSGTLRWNRNSVQSGTLLVLEGATLAVTGGRHEIREGFQAAGTGAVSVTAGELSLAAPLPLETLQVTLSGSVTVSGAFPVSNSPGGVLVVDRSLTFPGDLFIGGILRVASASRTVTVNGTLTLTSTGTLENPGTVRVGAFDNQGGTVTGNAPVVIGPGSGSVVEIRQIRIVPPAGEVQRTSVSEELLLIWSAPQLDGHVVETSADLVHWQPVPDTTSRATPDGFETRVRAILEGAQFFRVRGVR